MFSRILGKDIQEESLSPGYLFYGEESYLAEQFLQELRSLVVPPDAQDFRFDLFYPDETKWAEILDTAKTIPFIFSPVRIMVVRAPERKPEAEKSADKEMKLVSPAEGKLLKAYFSSPAPRTVLTVICPGKIGKSHPLVRFFSSLPGMVAKEVKPLREYEIMKWIDEKARSLQKMLTPEAAQRLFEVVGSDLRLLDNEMEKLAVYVDERKIVDAADVNEVTAWIRSYDQYELDNGLEKADFRECLIILDNLFKAGEKPEQILFRMIIFFRNVLMAKTRLLEKSRDKRDIFKEFFPQISEKWPLYQKKFTAFFSLVEGICRTDLARLLDELKSVDAQIKSTDVPFQTAFESFLFQYCKMRKKAGFTLKRRE